MAKRDNPAEQSEIVLDCPVAAEDGAAEIEKLQSQIAEKDKLISEKDQEIGELKDKYLRAMAEADNVRKRARQQSEESARIQRENMLRDLLPMVDNLERAVEAARGGGNGKPIVEGVELVLRGALDFLKAQGVTPVDAVGQPFNPEHHEAVDHVDTGEHPPNTVVDEFHRGYQIGERMLRPARVSVARGGPKADREGGKAGRRSDNGDADGES